MNTATLRTLRVVGPDELIARVNATSLDARARRLYPDSDYLQQEWIRAVGVVRKTTYGWWIERFAEKKGSS